MLTQPYKKLGRFLHEAGAVDPETGVVYMTEDEGPDGFYRFIPDTPGNLRKGVLQMLRVKGQPKYNTITGQTVGEVLECNWVTIDDPEPGERREQRVGRVPAGPGQGRREVPRRRGLHVPRRLGRVRLERRRRRRARSGLVSTRRRTTPAS